LIEYIDSKGSFIRLNPFRVVFKPSKQKEINGNHVGVT
jgi:hypothetical protein